jgi:dihydroflavonol-4-reductase
VRVAVTGATGFVGGHVARLLAERGDEVRVVHRDRARLERLRALDVEPVRADVLDRSAMRRALRGCEVVFHCAGLVASRPVERVFAVNALAPRIAVEAAAAEGAERVVVTSSVGGIGPVAPGEVGDEGGVYRHDGVAMAYPESKHEGEVEAFAAGARLGIEVVVVNPAYVLGAPVDRTQPGETSTRTIGNFLLGRLPAIVDGDTNIVHVEDVARGHVLAGDRGRPGERYVLGGDNVSWVEVMDLVSALGEVRHPLLVLPPEAAALARAGEAAGLSVPGLLLGEALTLMAQNWRYSSAKARRELGYRSRPLHETVAETVGWYRELIASGRFARRGVTPLSAAALGLRAAGRLGAASALRALERRAGRRLVVAGG